mgnify:CR=1 FL=1
MKKRLLISGMVFLCIITVIGILVCRKVWLHEMRQNRQLSQISSLETKIEENIVGQQVVAGDKRVTSAMENYEFDLDSESIFEGQNSDEEMGDYQICFYSKAEEFDKCVIGKGKGKYSGMYVVVTEDKLIEIRVELLEADAKEAVAKLKLMGVSQEEAHGLIDKFWNVEE